MLSNYRKKRDFEHTPEPPPVKRKSRGPLSFVIQKHAASRLHFDFRLEAGGVMKSWAVPKGPSLNPVEKRLAVMVEDHPVDYSSFEGNIPEGEYGAGQVIIWDRGTYSPEEEGNPVQDHDKAEKIMLVGLRLGRLKIYLRGERLQGSWALVRMQRSQKNWLLIKHDDEFARADADAVLAENTSVASGFSLQKFKEGASPAAENKR